MESQGRDQKALQTIDEAYLLAFEKHIKQRRKSGEPYIIHPVAVAESLIKFHCDTETIAAGLLHDVLEDTETSKEDLTEKFGETISELVEGVTKLGRLNFKSSEEAQANNFRKMLLAIAKDMRVVLVKLADRLNNMQTLDSLEPEKRNRIAQETLDIFAPLANRCGLHAIKTDLEDLALKHLHPKEYSIVKEMVNSKKEEREDTLKTIIDRIKSLLEASSIPASVHGRAKHFYSIYRKLKKQRKREGNDDVAIYDLLGIRLIVSSVKECYEALGIVHDAFRPVPGRFKDYIAMPKSNLYQSLHTTILGPKGRPLEIQIRTKSMHEIAENGIAAHWNYKESGSTKVVEKDQEQLTWIRQLIAWQTDLNDAQEYLDTVKVDLFSQEVYILSPAGDVYMLPSNSTPVDFAYRVHSAVGDHCIGAKVNERIVTLDYKLRNGDLVEIITNKNSHPNINWLSFVKTHQARHKIKSWYKKHNREDHISMARQMLENEVGGKAELERLLKSKEFLKAAQKLNSKTTEDLLAALGCGDTTTAQIAGKLKDTPFIDLFKHYTIPASKQTKIARKAPIKGDKADIPDLDGLLYTISKCCMPIPGEEVIGAISKGRGISIHRADCHNLKQFEQERLMKVNWGGKVTKTYPAKLTIEVVDRLGIVRDLLTLIADEGVNIQDFKVQERPTKATAILKTVVHVSSVDQLIRLTNIMKSMSDVVNLERE